MKDEEIIAFLPACAPRCSDGWSGETIPNSSSRRGSVRLSRPLSASPRRLLPRNRFLHTSTETERRRNRGKSLPTLIS